MVMLVVSHFFTPASLCLMSSPSFLSLPFISLPLLSIPSCHISSPTPLLSGTLYSLTPPAPYPTPLPLIPTLHCPLFSPVTLGINVPYFLPLAPNPPPPHDNTLRASLARNLYHYLVGDSILITDLRRLDSVFFHLIFFFSLSLLSPPFIALDFSIFFFLFRVPPLSSILSHVMILFGL